MKSYLNRLISSKFARSVVLISGGTAIAQILNAAFSPIITRIYTPNEYGVLTIYLSLLGIMSIAGSLRYEYAIPISDDDDKASNIIALCIFILVIISSIVLIVMLFFGDTLLKLLDARILSQYILLLPLGILLTGLYNIFHQWAFRKQNFSQISKTKINQSISQNVVAVGLGLLRFGPLGLIVSRIIGQSAGITTLGMDFLKRIPLLYKKIKRSDIIWSARRYRQFPLYSAPGQILNTAGIQLPVLFITSMYGAQVIGFYGLASSIVNLPMSLIGRSVADVFYAEAARIGRTEPRKLKKITDNLLKKLIILGMAPFLVLVIFAPFLFEAIYGSAWTRAGEFAQIMSFLVYVRFVFTPISNVFMVFEKQKYALFLDILRVLLVLAIFWSANHFQLSVYTTVSIYSAGMSAVYLTTFLLAQKTINSAIKSVDDIQQI